MIPMHISFHPLRDSRRSFTKTQKQAILHRQHYRCARCHQWLDLRATKFRHKRYWSHGGWTISRNGVALCSNCHDIVHFDERLWQNDYIRRDCTPLKKSKGIRKFVSWIIRGGTSSKKNTSAKHPEYYMW